jgi:hypothetical protein
MLYIVFQWRFITDEFYLRYSYRWRNSTNSAVNTTGRLLIGAPQPHLTSVRNSAATGTFPLRFLSQLSILLLSP